MRVLLLSLVFTLGGCSSLMNTSFYDDNESVAIVDVVMAVKTLDCQSPTVKDDVDHLKYKTDWMMTYSTLKRSKDILELMNIFNKSLTGMVEKDEIKPAYCEMKKKSMIKQTESIAEGVMRRF